MVASSTVASFSVIPSRSNTRANVVFRAKASKTVLREVSLPSFASVAEIASRLVGFLAPLLTKLIILLISAGEEPLLIKPIATKEGSLTPTKLVSGPLGESSVLYCYGSAEMLGKFSSPPSGKFCIACKYRSYSGEPSVGKVG